MKASIYLGVVRDIFLNLLSYGIKVFESMEDFLTLWY